MITAICLPNIISVFSENTYLIVVQIFSFKTSSIFKDLQRASNRHPVSVTILSKKNSYSSGKIPLYLLKLSLIGAEFELFITSLIAAWTSLFSFQPKCIKIFVWICDKCSLKWLGILWILEKNGINWKNLNPEQE